MENDPILASNLFCSTSEALGGALATCVYQDMSKRYTVYTEMQQYRPEIVHCLTVTLSTEPCSGDYYKTPVVCPLFYFAVLSFVHDANKKSKLLLGAIYCLNSAHFLLSTKY